MGIDRMLIAVVLIAPHPIEQLKTGKDLPRMAGKVVKQVELARRQIHRLAAQLNVTRQGVNA